MYSIFGLLFFVLVIVAISKIIGSSAADVDKVLWALAVLIFPVLGLIIWYLTGPGGKKV